MQYKTLIIDRRDRVLRVQLSRTRRRNALNLEMVEDLSRCFTAFAEDAQLGALVLFGDETAFCAGQDLKEPEPPDFLDRLNALLGQIEVCSKATIAAIDGWCIAGGLELALACDMRIASDRANIGDWHARINSLGGAGASIRLPRLIGLAQAKELMLTGDTVSGQRAHQVGLVNQVCSAAELEHVAIDLASRCAKIDPLTAARIKEMLYVSQEMPKDTAIALSRINQNRLLADLKVDIVAEYTAKKTTRD